MPPVAVGVAIAAGAAAAGATAAAVIGIAIAGTVAAGVLMNAMKPDIPNSDFGAGITNSGADVVIPVVYGCNRTGSALIYEHINGKWLTCVYVVSEGRIDGIDEIYLNGKAVGIRPLENQIYTLSKSDGGFGQAIKIQCNFGGDNQQALSLVDSQSSEWSKDHRVRGRACIAVSMHRELEEDTEIFSQPSLNAIVRGRRIKDIRNNKIAYSDNPALCLYDYLTNKRWGVGLDVSSIDTRSFIEAANYCDLNEIRLTCNGTVNQAQSLRNNIDEICSSFQGNLIETGGKFYCYVDKPSPVVYHFNEGNMIGASTTSYGSTSSYFNQLQIKFNDANDSVEPYSENYLTFPSQKNDIITKDGEVKAQSIELKFTKDKRVVEWISNVEFRRAQKRVHCSFKSNDEAFMVKPFDVVTITDNEQGWDKKKFRVVKTVKSFDAKNFGVIQFSCIEYSDWIYTGNETSLGGKSPSHKFPNEYEVPTPKALKWEQLSLEDTGAGKLTWTNPDSIVIRETLVDWKLSTDETWSRYGITHGQEIIIRNARNARYDFRVANRNVFGVLSSFEYLNDVNMTDPMVYPAVTGLKLNTSATSKLTIEGVDFSFSWDDMKAVDIKGEGADADGNGNLGRFIRHYEIQVYTGNTYKRTEFITDNSYVYSFDKNADDGLERDVTLKVRIVGKSGGVSPWAAITATNEQMPQLSGVVVDTSLTSLMVRYQLPTQQDFQAVEIHRSTQKGFKPFIDTLWKDTTDNNITETLDTKETYYFRLGSYDKFGRDNIVYSDEYSVTLNSIDDYLTNIDESKLSQDLQSKISVIDENKTNIVEEAKARANAITKEQGERAAAIESEATTRKTEIEVISNQVNTLTSISNSNVADLKDEKTARTNADSSLGKRIDSVVTSVGDNLASLNSSVEAISDKTTANVNQLSSLQTKVGDNTASLNVINSSLNGLTTKYAVQTDVNGVLSGFGLMNEGLKGSEFAVNANSFTVFNGVGNTVHDKSKTYSKGTYVNSPVIFSENGKAIQFMYKAKKDVPSSIDLTNVDYWEYLGSARQTAFEVKDNKVFIKKALIGKASIEEGHIANGAITNLKIGNVIHSNNYKADNSGWCINKDGSSEFQNIKARGLIESSQIRGSVIEGALIIGSSKVTVPTEADDGDKGTEAEPRYLCLPTSNVNVNAPNDWALGTIDTENKPATSDTAQTSVSNVVSANYTSDGKIQETGGEWVWKNMQRHRLCGQKPVFSGTFSPMHTELIPSMLGAPDPSVSPIKGTRSPNTFTLSLGIYDNKDRELKTISSGTITVNFNNLIGKSSGAQSQLASQTITIDRDGCRWVFNVHFMLAHDYNGFQAKYTYFHYIDNISFTVTPLNDLFSFNIEDQKGMYARSSVSISGMVNYYGSGMYLGGPEIKFYWLRRSNTKINTFNMTITGN
ncbi:hypothetical protein C942_00509 [Photobacterium marinum]|uniref:Tip attachment protein J central straight fiber domain-containing protein n=1 Tax=Photobacterium marinum TaxID=1056511 RepID=L8JF68_9GAMM|nr:phage tail protein [Photobacterium marinum]ELR66067.1 hypothetical protein C942_00509 [Photobacterium marinum]